MSQQKGKGKSVVSLEKKSACFNDYTSQLWINPRENKKKTIEANSYKFCKNHKENKISAKHTYETVQNSKRSYL